MARNAYEVEITDEIRAEGAAIDRELTALRTRFNAWVERVGADGSGFAQSSLDEAWEDVGMDISRFTDTDDEEVGS